MHSISVKLEMCTWRLALLALVFATCPRAAHAFFDPPWTTPYLPRAGDLLYANVHGGICDVIVEREGYPRITRTGTSIRLLAYGRHYEPGDELCIYGLQTVAIPLGTFEPGNYTLTVDLIYADPLLGPAVVHIGSVPLVVAVANDSPVSVPTLNPATASTLLVLMLGLGARSLQQKGRGVFNRKRGQVHF